MTKQKVIEVEYTDDDILYYIDDEQGNEIGFAVSEDGKTIEYYYDEPSLGDKVDAAVGKAVDGVVNGVKGAIDDDPFMSREGVVRLKEDLNVIYKENAETVNTLKSFAQDMRDFKDLFSGKPVRPRPQDKPEPAPVAVPESLAQDPDADHKKKKKKKKKKDKAEKKEHKQEQLAEGGTAASVDLAPAEAATSAADVATAPEDITPSAASDAVEVAVEMSEVAVPESVASVAEDISAAPASSEAVAASVFEGAPAPDASAAQGAL